MQPCSYSSTHWMYRIAKGIYPIRDQNLVCIDLQVVVALIELLKVSVVFSGHFSFNKITGD